MRRWWRRPAASPPGEFGRNDSRTDQALRLPGRRGRAGHVAGPAHQPALHGRPRRLRDRGGRLRPALARRDHAPAGARGAAAGTHLRGFLPDRFRQAAPVPGWSGSAGGPRRIRQRGPDRRRPARRRRAADPGGAGRGGDALGHGPGRGHRHVQAAALSPPTRDAGGGGKRLQRRHGHRPVRHRRRLRHAAGRAGRDRRRFHIDRGLLGGTGRRGRLRRVADTAQRRRPPDRDQPVGRAGLRHVSGGRCGPRVGGHSHGRRRDRPGYVRPPPRPVRADRGSARHGLGVRGLPGHGLRVPGGRLCDRHRLADRRRRTDRLGHRGDAGRPSGHRLRSARRLAAAQSRPAASAGRPADGGVGSRRERPSARLAARGLLVGPSRGRLDRPGAVPAGRLPRSNRAAGDHIRRRPLHAAGPGHHVGLRRRAVGRQGRVGVEGFGARPEVRQEEGDRVRRPVRRFRRARRLRQAAVSGSVGFAADRDAAGGPPSEPDTGPTA